MPLFTDAANVLPLNFLNYQTISNLMHCVHDNMVPSGILNLFTASSSGDFYVNSSNLDLNKLSFSRFEAKLWNEMPCHIWHLPKNNFKNTLRELLFEILN